MRYLYNDDLTSTEIKISDKVCANLQEVIEMNITDLADFCGVSPSKITKYAKRLGFSGFKEFQYQLKNDKYLTKEKGSTLDYQKDKIMDFFDSFDEVKFKALKKEIFGAEKIYLFGRGPSLKVCEYYEPRLRVATRKNIVCDYDEYLFDLEVRDQLADQDENRLLIVLTVSGKTPKVHEVLQTAKRRGFKTICISAYKSEKLSKGSDLYIPLINRKEMFDKSLIRGRTLFYIYFETLTQECIENPIIKK